MQAQGLCVETSCITTQSNWPQGTTFRYQPLRILYSVKVGSGVAAVKWLTPTSRLHDFIMPLRSVARKIPPRTLAIGLCSVPPDQQLLSIEVHVGTQTVASRQGSHIPQIHPGPRHPSYLWSKNQRPRRLMGNFC